MALPEVKIAYFGSNYYQDVFSIIDLNRRLKGDGSLARWEAIAVIEEFSFVDKELEEGKETHLIVPNEKLLGDSYFYDEPTSECPQLKEICKIRPRNYFLSEIEKVTRYAVAFVKNIDRLV